MKDESYKIRHAVRAVWIVAIIIVSTAFAMMFTWRAPGISLYARDWLMQARGPLPAPDDIVIVAVDEASIVRFGRFPWPRGLAARVLDSISSAQPKAIALDVLYSEPSDTVNDTALASAIKRTENTVVASQLIEETDESGRMTVRWLRPISIIQDAASGIGHSHVSTEADGEARELPLRKADKSGNALWSIAAETIRVGEGLQSASIRDTPVGVQLGNLTIPLAGDISQLNLHPQDGHSDVDVLPSDRMMIDYVGPPGPFSHQTFSFADVFDGKVQPENFRGRYVLIGATAATLGDHVSSPFVHANGIHGEQHGQLMSGVEVLANAINTILRSRFYREVPDWLAALIAALTAAAVLSLLTIAQGRFESIKQLSVLAGFLAGILGASYIAFAHWLILPPVVPTLISFATAAPLALLRRSLRTSADLDLRLNELARGSELFPLSGPLRGDSNRLRPNPASLIARLVEADTVAIYLQKGGAEGGYHLVASHGAATCKTLTAKQLRDAISLAPATLEYFATEEKSPIPENESRERLFDSPRIARSTWLARPLIFQTGASDSPKGALLIGEYQARQSRDETLRLCLEIATVYTNGLEDEEDWLKLSTSKWHLPRGVEWKARSLGTLHRRLFARARYVDRALRSAEDGLIVADISGQIAFANPRSAAILGVQERGLIGSDLFHRLHEIDSEAIGNDERLDRGTHEMLMRVVIERSVFEREVKIGYSPSRFYMLRLSPVTSRDDGGGEVLGLIAALSDVTQQHELKEIKADVMALVTHELRTPLTAIQGMSELLAKFNVNADRQRQMHCAINDEAKRLARMIDDYLNITTLESGARPLRLVPVRITSLVERVVLLLDPLAVEREIRIVSRLAPNLPALLSDVDLISQALTNLIANAIKYSPAKSTILVEARTTGEAVLIEVADNGYGIPANALPHIFEKFYRVPRVEDDSVPGTGLGLPIVREIVELHGGRVKVESEQGIGSTFSIYLPLRPPEM